MAEADERLRLERHLRRRPADQLGRIPQPRTAISLAIFLHEVGHHAIGFSKYKRRCEEEYHVWLWAIGQMRELGIEPDERVIRRFEMSMQYAVGKAVRRGIKDLPEALGRFAVR